jgi:hypothetical protein
MLFAFLLDLCVPSEGMDFSEQRGIPVAGWGYLCVWTQREDGGPSAYLNLTLPTSSDDVA